MYIFKYIRLSLLALPLCFVLACGPATLNKAETKGVPALDARSIFDLVAGNSMELTAYDFNGRIYFSRDGQLSAIDTEGQKDYGSWDISTDNRICLRFRLWYYGDLKCYSIVPAPTGNKVSFFTTNGAAYYTGSVRQGDTANLAVNIPQKKSKRFLRSEFAQSDSTTTQSSAKTTPQAGETAKPQPADPAPQPALSDDPTAVRRLAKNCPGCNLAGADLKELDLVNANLEGADLSRADLRYANLRRANLAGADLSAAKLNHANLPGADLRNCNLRNADLEGANLLMTDLTGADITGANLANAYLENAKGIE